MKTALKNTTKSLVYLGKLSWAEEDNLKCADIHVMFLAPNITLLLQFMNENVIQIVKMHYIKGLLYKVLSMEDSAVMKRNKFVFFSFINS